jgi:threonine aldolase
MFPRQANSVFLELPPHVIESLRAKGWQFYTFIGVGGVRLMCSWNTSLEAVEQFIGDLEQALAC